MFVKFVCCNCEMKMKIKYHTSSSGPRSRKDFLLPFLVGASAMLLSELYVRLVACPTAEYLGNSAIPSLRVGLWTINILGLVGMLLLVRRGWRR